MRTTSKGDVLDTLVCVGVVRLEVEREQGSEGMVGCLCAVADLHWNSGSDDGLDVCFPYNM